MGNTITLQDIAGWIAPIATTIAAIMTAANLGTRVTGWGFVVFTIGSIAWSTVAISTGQSNLLWANGFLTLVNLIGIWRWLGRQAKHEDGRDAATRYSAAAAGVPTLFGVGSLVGAALTGRDGEQLGVIVDGMMRCEDSRLSYLVIGEGGVAGVGERLHALAPETVRFSNARAECDLTLTDLKSLPVLDPERWPAEIDREAGRVGR
ncbi:PRC-barrel domain-containing protein [Sphingomonas aliaeris]|nr:PRC-barrel domain-containing protein [Sphingomonas aliaeris]